MFSLSDSAFKDSFYKLGSFKSIDFSLFIERCLRKIVFITLSGILAAKVLHPLPPFLALSSHHTMVFYPGVLKICKKSAHVTFNILAISFIITQCKFENSN